MKLSRPTSALRLSLAAVLCLSATALAAGWSPGEWIGRTPLGRALVARASAPRFGLGGGQTSAVVTASKTGVLLDDVDSDGLADPGDTIRYTVAVSADATADATGVHLADTLDANTTLVPGSIAITPLTTDDSYLSVGNMTLTSAAIAADCAGDPLRSVTCNDALSGATVVGFGPLQSSANGTVANGVNTVTTASGGKVALAADGTFVYEPLAGYESVGTPVVPDEFWYTVSNSAGTAAARATVTVGSAGTVNQTNKMVWFVSVAGGGTGTQARPMTLVALAAINNGTGLNPANGDTVYLFEGTHASGFTLRANQKLIGQDATVSVATLGGPAPYPGNVYPALDPTVTKVNTNAISLNGGNTVAGFTAGNSATAMSGSSSGTLSVREVVINGISRALTLTSATVVTDATFTGFTSTSSASGTTGIQLSAVNGTVNLGGGLLNANTGVAFVVVGGNAVINYAGGIQNSGSRQVSITNKTGGAVNFTGFIGGTGTGIFLDNNDLGSPGVAEITFSGGMGTVALTATNGGIVNVCNRNPCGTGSAVVNTLSSPTATVLNITGTSIGANGATFRSLTSGNSGSSIATGITLSGTGTLGGLTVTGNGTAGSGGTIQRKTGADNTPTQGTGLSLINTAGVSLAWMQLNDFSNHAIRGTNVTGLTLSHMVINGSNGTTTTAQREGAVHIDGLFTTGSFASAQTASISDSTIGGTGVTDASLTDDLRILNTTGTLDRLTITNSSFGIVGGAGFNGVEINAQNAAIMKVTVTDSFFTSAGNALLHATAAATGTLDVVARRNTMSNNNAGAGSASGLVIDGESVGTATVVTYDVSCNAISGSGAPAVAILKGPGSGAWSGSIGNNTIGVGGVANSGSTLASGITVASNGTGSQTVMIADNRVHQTNRSGIWLTAGDSQLGSNPGQGVMNATLFHNVVDEPGSASIAGLSIDGGTVSTDTNVVNVVVGASSGIQQNDFSAGDFATTRDVTTTGTAGAVINLSTNGSASGTAGAVIKDDNLNPATTSTSIAGTVNLVSSMPVTPPAVASCTQVAGLETPGTTGRLALARATDGSSPGDLVALAASQPAAGSRIAILGMQVRMAAVDVQAALLTTVTRSAAAAQSGAYAVWNGVRSLAAIVGDALVARLEAQPAAPEVDVDLGTVLAGRTVTVVFTVTVNAAPVAQYLNQATVSGTNFSDVLTNTVTTPGDRFDTVTALMSSLNPAGTGASVTFTATVTPSAGAITPDGTVQFMDGAGALGSAVTCADAGSNTCAAALTTAALTAGTHSITAVYSGGTNYDASTSGPVSQVITPCTANPVVTTGTDAGAGSLRQAITDACAGSTIAFDGAVSAVGLTSDQLTIDKDLTISGPGASLLTVQRGSGTFRIFSVTPNRTVTLQGLTIAGGSVAAAGPYPANAGGAIYNDHGTLTISGSTVSGNAAASGGGIFNDGTTGTVSLTIVGSTLSGNTSLDGGAVYNNGVSGGTATAAITNSTISGNTANGNGGGVYNLGSTAASAVLTITGSTVTNNHADQDSSGAGTGGGVSTVTSTALLLRNTIVAGNYGGTGTTTADDVNGAVDAASSFTLVGADTGMSGLTHGSNGNQVGTALVPIDARLGALANNGGHTLTHTLLAGSPALDAGDNARALGTADQRGTGFGRILDAADTNTTQTVDLGAVEADPSIEDVTAQTTNEDTALTFVFNVGDGATAFDAITATSSNTTLVPNANAVVTAGSASTRTLTLTPAAGLSGTTTITLTVTKTGRAMADTFVLTVTAVNDPPTLNAIANPAAIPQNAGQQTVNLTGIGTGGEAGQTLTVTASSSNTGLIPNPTVSYASPGATGSLSYTPMAGVTGTAIVTVTVTDDGGGQNSITATFTVTVSALPTISNIADQQVPASTTAQIPLTVGDAETAATALTVTAVSSNQGVVPDGGLVVSAGGASRTLALTPVPNTTGTATITVTVTDGAGGTAVDTFIATVVPSLTLGDATVTEGNSGTVALTFTVTLAGPSASAVTVSYATAQRTAIAGVDYVTRTGAVTFQAGVTGPSTFAVTVAGDTAAEIDETLVVTLSGATGGAVVTQAQGVGTIADDDATTDRRAAFAVWTAPVAVTAPVGTLTKTAGLGWNAGAVSTQTLIDSDGSMEFTASETTTIRSAGLSRGNTDTNFSDIDFSLELYEGRVFVVEGGVQRGVFASYQANDRFAVVVTSGVVSYQKNGMTFYTSAVAPAYPLLVDTALYTPAATVTDVVLSGRLARSVIWTNLAGVTAAGSGLTKTAAAGWNSGAASTRALVAGDGADDFTTPDTTTQRLLGLSRDNANTDFSDIDFGILAASNGTFYVFESGISRGMFGSYAAGDRFQVAVDGGQVVYRHKGIPVYTSAVAPVYPLLVDTALFTPGATLTEVSLSGRMASDVAFTNVAGAAAVGNTLTKTAATGWNAAASSTRALARGDGFVEFTTSEATTQKLAGLSHGDTNTDFADLDFGVLLAANGSVYVFEGGVSRGMFGTYRAGDRFRVGVEGGVVRYRRNGVLFYTSGGAAPVYPLLVDTAIYSPGATIADVVLAGDLGEAVAWTSLVRATAAGSQLTKTGTLGWNAEAISTRAIAAGDGTVAFTTLETTTQKLLGLSHGNTSPDFSDVDFGILLASNGTSYVFETGITRGVFGAYVAGDRFEVAVAAGVVTYLKNGAVFYTSGTAPVYPLLVDTALYTPGATLSDVVLSCASAACQ